MSHGRVLLLTGATGFLGRRIVATLLSAPAPWERIHLLVRPRHCDPARRRVERLARELGVETGPLRALEGDLTRPGLGLEPEHRRRIREEVTAILHVGAETAIDAPIHVARPTNVDGTRRLLELAGECARLRRFDHVSWAYAGGNGDPKVPVAEADFDPGRTRFRTPVEQSIHEAEALVRARTELPLTIHRLSFPVLDGDPLLRAVRAGAELLAPFRPASTRSRSVAHLDVVPARWAARTLCALLTTPEAEGDTFHLTAGPDRTLPHGPPFHPPLMATLGRHPRRLESWAFALARKLGTTAIFQDRDWQRAHRSASYLRYLQKPGPTFLTSATRTLLSRLGVPRPRF